MSSRSGQKSFEIGGDMEGWKLIECQLAYMKKTTAISC